MQSSQLRLTITFSLAAGAADAIMIIERVARNFILVVGGQPSTIYIDATLIFVTLSTWRSKRPMLAKVRWHDILLVFFEIDTLDNGQRRSAVWLPVSRFF
jgi:hypothetical protein